MALSSIDGIPEPKGKIFQVDPGTIIACRGVKCGGLAVPVEADTKVAMVYRIVLIRERLHGMGYLCNLALLRVPRGSDFIDVDHLIQLRIARAAEKKYKGYWCPCTQVCLCFI